MDVLETPCSLWKFLGWPQCFLSWVSALLPSERCWVCWTAPQLLSGKTLTPRYHCYDTDAACGKLKVSLTVFLPLLAYAHTSTRTIESSAESTERKRERLREWEDSKNTYWTAQFYCLCGQIQSTTHLLLALKCPICLRQENIVYMLKWRKERAKKKRQTFRSLIAMQVWTFAFRWVRTLVLQGRRAEHSWPQSRD